MKKRIFAAVLASAMVLSLAACGKSGGSSSSNLGNNSSVSSSQLDASQPDASQPVPSPVPPAAGPPPRTALFLMGAVPAVQAAAGPPL